MVDDALRTEIQFVSYLRVLVRQHGSQKALAKYAGVSLSYLCDVLHGRRAPGAKLVEGVGFEKIVVYRQKRGA